MERISVNPSRLKWACDDRGITVGELADAVSAGVGTLARALEGEDGLTFGQLRSVARFFNRGVLFFVEPGPVVEASLRTPEFRTLANQKPDLTPELRALIERAEQHRDVYLGLREELDDGSPGTFDPPRMDGFSLPQAAGVARRWLGLGDRNDFASYRQAIEAKGILVFMAVGYFGAWRLGADSPIVGFSVYDTRCPVILVKKQRAVGRQSFTLIHELGHVLLHRRSIIDEEGDLLSAKGREREANQFAAHLLVPDAFLSRMPLADRPSDMERLEEWLRPWRREWGASGETILLRLVEAERIDRSVYERYVAWRRSVPMPEPEGGSREHRFREPLHLFGDGYVRTVLEAMNADRISLNKASGFLDNLKVSDVRKLEGHLARV